MKEQQSDGTSRPVRRHPGERNAQGQTYLVRNAFFEPSQSSAPRTDAVGQCLRDIRAAFHMRKPAVISTHRINFCGFLYESNRDENLKALRRLLESLTLAFPDIEFLSSAELTDAIGPAKHNPTVSQV